MRIPWRNGDREIFVNLDIASFDEILEIFRFESGQIFGLDVII